MAPRFIHLRVHSAYSLLEGAVPVKALAEMCRAAGMPAVALTDTGNLFAALEFSETMAKAGIQPIMGCQLALAHAAPPRPGERAPEPRPVVLLAQDEGGFANLMRLSSLNYLDCGAEAPHVTLAALEAHAGGLICLTGGAEGAVGQLLRDNQPAKARALAGAAGGGLSRAGSTSRSSATRRTALPAPPPRRRPSRGSSSSPTRSSCRSSPPTTCTSPTARCTPRTTR